MNGSYVVSILVGVTAVMVAALGVTSVWRRHRAATRHALLVAAFVIVLVLPAASAIAPYLTIRVRIPAPAAVADAVASLDLAPVMPVDFTSAPADGAPAVLSPLRMSFRSTVVAVWLIGLAACLLPVAIGLVQVRSLGRSGLPWQRGRALADTLAASIGIRRRIAIVLHESVSGPMTYGTLWPTILLPLDAERWADGELTRAIVHELEHIRRADWLTQCLARTLCAAYWFHPLFWIARRQLVLEAERAADDAVLQHGDASEYADQLVDLARRLSAGHRPALAMANRHDLAARVRALLDAKQPRGRAGAWLVAGVSCVAAVLVGGLSPLRVVAQSPRLQFDVVSVRPCDPRATAPAPAGGGRGGGSLAQASPGRFRTNCLSVNLLIRDAYVTYAGGRYTPRSAQPSFDVFNAGPDWIRSERFTIEATTADATPVPVMRGPMLQALLEDRFKLKVHRETREVPIYELVVAKGGAKVTPFKPGTCVPYDMSVSPQPPLEAGQRRCATSTVKDGDGNWVNTVEAMTLDDWVAGLNNRALVLGEPPIVNRTGITGLQTFRYVGRSEDFAVDIKSQLGLELRSGRGPREFLILDHVERPVLDRTIGVGNPPSAGTPTAR